ncbi:MAG: hypothetical protein FWF57_01020 [Defluviitaleaceae bacterium]|nr:hypothetical protein [Defluviitaleaceae bacterium]
MNDIACTVMAFTVFPSAVLYELFVMKKAKDKKQKRLAIWTLIGYLIAMTFLHTMFIWL